MALVRVKMDTSSKNVATDGSESGAFEPVRVASVSDTVYVALRKAIISGQAGSGTHLREREVAQQMGVSTTPVKEALNRLEYEGLVKRNPRRSWVVAATGDLLEDTFLARVALEGVVARLAAQRMTGAEIDELEQHLERMRLLNECGDRELLLEANQEFHTRLREGCRSPLVARLLNTFSEAQHEQLELWDRGALRLGMSRGWEEHCSVFLAVRRRDGDAAEKAMLAHIRRVYKQLSQ